MKLNFIDSIRGLAILMVVLVHTSQNVKLESSSLLFLTNYGQLGVQMFFVVSAYTLCLSSENRMHEKRKHLKFAIRRYFRIAPAYYCGIWLYFIIRTMLNIITIGKFEIPEEYTFLNVISNIAFFHGFYEPGNQIVPGGWSIGTEMAFYAIFPLLWIFALKALKSSGRIFLFLLVGISFSLVIIYLFYLNGISIKKNYFLYFNLINQLPVFLVGISYYFYREHLKLDWNHKFDILYFLLFLSVSLYAFSFNLNFIFHILAALSFVFLTEIFRKYQSLNHRLLVRIGQVSFSMYLLHFVFAIYLTPYIVSKFYISNEIIRLLFYFTFVSAVTYLSALISEKIIEKPGISIGRLLIKKL